MNPDGPVRADPDRCWLIVTEALRVHKNTLLFTLSGLYWKSSSPYFRGFVTPTRSFCSHRIGTYLESLLITGEMELIPWYILALRGGIINTKNRYETVFPQKMMNFKHLTKQFTQTVILRKNVMEASATTFRLFTQETMFHPTCKAPVILFDLMFGTCILGSSAQVFCGPSLYPVNTRLNVSVIISTDSLK